MMAMALALHGYEQPMPIEKRTRPKLDIPPQGTKQYFFNAIGEFSNTQMRKDECVFICYAINDKNAIRKFNKSLGK